MKLLKRAIATFLALVLALNIFTFAPLYNESYGNTVYAASTSDEGVPLYQANVIAKGYNSDGDGYYKLFKSFQDPVYYELTDYMLEDNILRWTSNFWNAAFNSEFQKNPSYFYEVMLMGYLKYEQKEINTSGIWDSKEMALATEIYKELADQLIGAVETPNYKQFLNQVKNMSNDELKRVLKNVDCIKLSSDILDDLSKGLDYGTEFIDAVAEYEALFDAKSERIESLKLLRSKVTDNDYFTKAVDDIIEKMEQTPISYVAGKMIDKLWDDFLDTAWNLIIDGSPIATVLKAIDIEKMTLDVLFNSSDTASNNFKLLVLYIVDTYFDSALEQSLKNYNSTSSVSNGVTLIQCYKGYIEYQMYGLDYTKTFINDIVDGGSIHHIIEQIFFKESIQSAEELTRLCDSQISSRQRLLELLGNSADIYYGKTGLNELVDALNETEEQNVPVTSISFKQSEITLKSSKDICMISADVYPENATNKKVTYTSSDPSILSVPENGGFATQKGEGTVTVTATAEDGGLTATQTVNVKYATALTVDNRGKCGDDVYWTLYSDGTLYISGTGEMYNYTYIYYGSFDLYTFTTPWWDYRRDIKKVILGEEVTSIGQYAFEGCSNLRKIIFGENFQKINRTDGLYTVGDTFMGCTSFTEFEGNGKFFKAYQGMLYSKDMSTLVAVPTGKSGEIRVNDGTEIISKGAFWWCSKIISVYIPESVLAMFGYNYCEFKGCEKLQNIEVDELNVNYYSVDGVLFGTGRGAIGKYHPYLLGAYGVYHPYLIAYPSAKSDTNYDIPNGVQSIETYAFFEASNLEKITFPKSIRCIYKYAFENCRNISDVTFNGDIPDISDKSEGKKSYLKIFNGVKNDFKIHLTDKAVYQNQSGVWIDENIILRDHIINSAKWTIDESGTLYWSDGNVNENGYSVEDEIPWYDRKDEIKNVVIGNGVDYIGDYTFMECENLETITISDGVKSIGSFAFWGCNNLKSINVATDNPNYISTDGVLFNKNKTEIVIYPSAKEGKYAIPNTVTAIGENSFRECRKLSDLVIPDSVTTIGAYAFYDCTSLLNVTIPKSVKEMDYCGLGLLFSKGEKDDKIKGFVMKGYARTVAEAYAKDNGLTFEDITKVISNPESTTVPLTKPIVQEKTTSAEDKSNDNLTQKKVATTKIKKITRAKKSLKVKWKKVKGVSGYQIQYSTSSKFKKAKKITIKNAKTTSKTIKKLKENKKYYVRIRTYIVVKGKKKYSGWSKKKSQKTK